MSGEARSVRWFVFVLLIFSSRPLPGRQNSSAAGAQTAPASQDDPQGAPPDSQGNAEPASNDALAAPATPAQPARSQSSPLEASPASDDSPKDSRKPALESHAYAIAANYSVTLPFDWTSAGANDVPMPTALSSYAPFRLSGDLVLSNVPRGAILQFATSNNPFVGHDAYWLDTEMHAPSGTGMSLLDFFFYYFFPPSDACMHQVLTTSAPASRQSLADGPAYMQVYYSCPISDTLSDFYSVQISSGITFQHTDDGTRILAPVGDFYVAPMEQVDQSGMTFFVFEAQGMNAVSSDAAKRFHLPESAQGGAPDFFWAIGSPSPFPFVADSGRKDVSLLHVAYARLGVEADAKTEFLNILREIRTH